MAEIALRQMEGNFPVPWVARAFASAKMGFCPVRTSVANIGAGYKAENVFSKTDERLGRRTAPSAPPPDATTGRARSPSAPQSTIPTRLRRLANLLKQGLITEGEYVAQRTRILNEL